MKNEEQVAVRRCFGSAVSNEALQKVTVCNTDADADNDDDDYGEDDEDHDDCGDGGSVAVLIMMTDGWS